MTSFTKLITTLAILLLVTAAGYCSDAILVLRFDCQGKASPLAKPLEDSLKANLRLLNIPTVQRSRWQSLIQSSGFKESDMNYNPPVLSRLVNKLGAKGAVYGQVYEKNGMLILDAYYIEPGAEKPIDIEPMVGYKYEDILDMTWELAVIVSQEDKRPPKVSRVEPSDSAVLEDQYIWFSLYFDEPMNPESFAITGEPEDMFFTVGDYVYNERENCFKVKMHLYPGKSYTFRVNGPGIKPFLDRYGNVAETFEWQVFTR